MKTADINYKTSTDYARLYDLLKGGTVLVGFLGIEIKSAIKHEYCKLVELKYEPGFRSFYIGVTLFEINFNKDNFCKMCEKYNLKFIDVR